MKIYAYVGPHEIKRKVADAPPGTPVRTAGDLVVFDEPLTFVVGVDGVLRVADRHSEHVACAGGGQVLSAGELTATKRPGADVVRIVEISNQSTGFCPEPESWPAVASALEAAGIAHPGRFTVTIVFRRCVGCGERNIVKDDWYECALCGEELPRAWNF